MALCVHCAKPILRGEEICPGCGGEQPVAWLVSVVYFLTFLFVQGTVYRLIWPNVNSIVHYIVYFAVTAAIAIAFLRIRKLLSGYLKAAAGGSHDKEPD